MNNNTILSRLLKVLFFISLLFIVIYLIKNNWLEMPVIYSPSSLIFSIILLIIGFIIDAGAWHTMVKSGISTVSYRDAFISTGKYIFAKYIPGKFWIILGKAGYLRGKYKHSLIKLTSFSFYYQLISLISGAIIGLAIIYIINEIWFWVFMILIVIFIVFFMALNKPVLHIISKVLSFIFKRRIDLPLVSPKITLNVFLLSFLNWLIWSFSFFLFLQAVCAKGISSIAAGFIFPVSSVLGIIVLIAPGGLGIREGFMTLGLVAIGLSAKEAASVAIISRLWFLIGEFFFFGTAIVAEIYYKRKQ